MTAARIPGAATSWCWLLLGAALVAEPAVAFATPSCASAPRRSFPVAPSDSTLAVWSPPLDRLVSFHAYEISLREALDRLAAAGRLRLSYSAELLPLDRVVCASFDSTPVGMILSSVLQGTTVHPLVAAVDHVVLAPGSVAPVVNQQPILLDRVVVTGNPAGASERPMPIALNVVRGSELPRESGVTMAEALDAGVPGIWLWQQSPASVLAGYGSIRGASSFGLSYPMVYIDGIEVANPLLVTRLIPDAVERVEVIRGPQGAVLYGADAISGVTNIVTRVENADGGPPRAAWQGFVGLANSAFSQGPVFGQEHLFKLRAGSNTQSAGLNVTLGEDGAYLPGAFSHRLGVQGSARQVGSHTIATATLRFFAEEAAQPTSPLLSASSQALDGEAGGPVSLAGSPDAQSVVQYTLGTNVRFLPDSRWTHSLTAGIDGYTLNGVTVNGTPLPTPADSALLAARGSATRGSLRWSSVRRFDLGSNVSADFTFAADQSVLRQVTTNPTTGENEDRYAPATGVIDWRSITGASALASATLLRHLFLSGGLRAEYATEAGSATVPTAGAAWVIERGPVTVKLRAAYGEGVRWSGSNPRETLWEGFHVSAAQAGLGPERQAGTEAGFDLIAGQGFTLQVTRFDQTASGLIQPVAIPLDSTRKVMSDGRTESVLDPHISYELQNVGVIANRGWEVQGASRLGALVLSASFSTVDSRVRQVASGYTGDLLPGDRMLGVPARMLSATAGWNRSRWSTSFTAYRAFDWINYDRVALAQARTNSTASPYTQTQQFTGVNLRSYWMTYPGVTHLRATASWMITHGVGLHLTADNLLNQQTGEPDNSTILPGRTITVGLRSDF